MIAFASIDPHKGKMGAMRGAAADRGLRGQGLQVPPPMQDFHPADRMAWPIYEVIAEYGLSSLFHTGH